MVSRLYILAFATALLFGCTETIDRGTVAPTWSNSIGAIVYQNCTPCHRPSQSGSFNLLSYSDAVKRAKLIKFVTGNRYMPPWPADPGYSHFINERVLSDEQIGLIKTWVDSGTPRGDSVVEPPVPVFYEGSYFGKPDLVIKAQRPIPLKGNGNDAFLIVKYPYHIAKDTLVDVVEFVPHRRKLVHHVNGHLVSYSENRNFDHFGGISMHSDTRAQLMDVYRDMHIPYTDGFQPQFPTLTPNVVYYLPGYIPPAYPDNVGGYHLKKDGLFLLNNIHYGPAGEDQLDSSYLNVFFRKRPIERAIYESQLGTFGVSRIEPELIIPAGDVKTFHTQTQLDKTISLLSVNPHMHLIGKTFVAFAIKPGGDTVPLIRIRKWDFRWQYYYTFKHPVVLEAGTRIHVYGTYDNTNNNVNNPFHPPRTITQGNGVESMKTTEEMFQFIYTYMAYRQGDETIDLERRPPGTDQDR